jgi:hypothetical protein
MYVRESRSMDADVKCLLSTVITTVEKLCVQVYVLTTLYHGIKVHAGQKVTISAVSFTRKPNTVESFILGHHRYHKKSLRYQYSEIQFACKSLLQRSLIQWFHCIKFSLPFHFASTHTQPPYMYVKKHSDGHECIYM